MVIHRFDYHHWSVKLILVWQFVTWQANLFRWALPFFTAAHFLKKTHFQPAGGEHVSYHNCRHAYQYTWLWRLHVKTGYKERIRW